MFIWIELIHFPICVINTAFSGQQATEVSLDRRENGEIEPWLRVSPRMVRPMQSCRKGHWVTRGHVVAPEQLSGWEVRTIKNDEGTGEKFCFSHSCFFFFFLIRLILKINSSWSLTCALKFSWNRVERYNATKYVEILFSCHTL